MLFTEESKIKLGKRFKVKEWAKTYEENAKESDVNSLQKTNSRKNIIWHTNSWFYIANKYSSQSYIIKA